MESREIIFSLPRQLFLRFAIKLFQNNSSLVDKLEQSYFSKGYM